MQLIKPFLPKQWSRRAIAKDCTPAAESTYRLFWGHWSIYWSIPVSLYQNHWSYKIKFISSALIFHPWPQSKQIVSTQSIKQIPVQTWQLDMNNITHQKVKNKRVCITVSRGFKMVYTLCNNWCGSRSYKKHVTLCYSSIQSFSSAWFDRKAVKYIQIAINTSDENKLEQRNITVANITGCSQIALEENFDVANKCKCNKWHLHHIKFWITISHTSFKCVSFPLNMLLGISQHIYGNKVSKLTCW